MCAQSVDRCRRLLMKSSTGRRMRCSASTQGTAEGERACVSVSRCLASPLPSLLLMTQRKVVGLMNRSSPNVCKKNFRCPDENPRELSLLSVGRSWTRAMHEQTLTHAPHLSLSLSSSPHTPRHAGTVTWRRSRRRPRAGHFRVPNRTQSNSLDLANTGGRLPTKM